MPSHTQDAPEQSQSGAPTYTLCDIAVSHIVVSPNNPRKQFDEQELARLAHAMSTRGFNHPILVRPTEREGYYEIIDGERRWRAAQQAAVETIPALVKTRASVPGDDLLDAMLANGLGISLDVLEEALGYQALISDHGYSRKGLAEALQIPQARGARAADDPRAAREGPSSGRRRARAAGGREGARVARDSPRRAARGGGEAHPRRSRARNGTSRGHGRTSWLTRSRS